MSLQKLESLILRNLRYGDTSRIVTVLSREFGKWSGLAKGVRTPKSRFGASLELLNLSTLVCYFRPGRDLKLISDGSLDREFRGLLQHSQRYHYGCAVAEFCDKILEEEASVPEIFDLTIRVLGLLEETSGPRLGYLFSAYCLRVAGLIGYAPRLDRCARCGSERAGAFGPVEGGILCGRCREEVPSALPMSPPTLGLLRKIGRGALPREPEPATIDELSALTEAFLGFHIDRYRSLKSLRALRELASMRISARPRLRAPRP